MRVAYAGGFHRAYIYACRGKRVNCLYFHCFAHSLNLAIQGVTKRCELLRNCMEFIFQLVQLIKCSPKRLNLFETVRKEVKFSDGESVLSDSPSFI